MSYWAAAGSIVLTGGRRNSRITAQTSLLAVQTGQWEQRSFPDLNIARYCHASMSLDKQVYVACGVGNDDEFLSSVEMLRLGAKAWELIKIPDFTNREYPIISQIDSQTIAILGGRGSIGYSSGVILNAETCAVVRLIDPVSEIKFACSNQSF